MPTPCFSYWALTNLRSCPHSPTPCRFAIGVLYPTFESFRAIESRGSSDDTQWLAYWVVYAVFNLVQTLLWPVLIWIPLYSLAKVGALAWLVLPQFLGATFVYHNYVRPFLLAVAEKLKENPKLEPYVRDFVKPLEGKAKDIKKQLDVAANKAQDAYVNAQERSQEEFQPLKAHAQ